MRCFLTVEGHGEVHAAGNLLWRLTQDLELPLVWMPPRRGLNLHQEQGIRKAAEYVRLDSTVEAWLVLRDEDDACPREKGPQMASWLREAGLPFPSAVVLLHPEYEVLFLPCLHLMAGQPLGDGVTSRPGIQPGVRWDGSSWEARRDVKGWLSSHYAPNRSYKPTTDQLELTRRIDFAALRQDGPASFGTLERALRFLAANAGRQGAVYP